MPNPVNWSSLLQIDWLVRLTGSFKWLVTPPVPLDGRFDASSLLHPCVTAFKLSLHLSMGDTDAPKKQKMSIVWLCQSATYNSCVGVLICKLRSCENCLSAKVPLKAVILQVYSILPQSRDIAEMDGCSTTLRQTTRYVLQNHGSRSDKAERERTRTLWHSPAAQQIIKLSSSPTASPSTPVVSRR